MARDKDMDDELSDVFDDNYRNVDVSTFPEDQNNGGEELDMTQNTDPDMFRILIASDIHIGFQEKDGVRKHDSLNTFEEILQQAKHQDVDFILLAGDLFDENKPSLEMKYKTTQLIRQYCFGDRQNPVVVMSEGSTNFSHSQFPHANYEDLNLNVSIPIFSINGNHDDLAGSGLSVMDLMHEMGMINYFGKQVDCKDIEVSPLILRKGTSRLAIYGLGSQKDERLHREMANNRITWKMPKKDGNVYYNMLVLHQNREKCGRVRTNAYIPEHFIPEFFDMTIWGHEHACKTGAVQLQSARVGERGTGYVIQPGSSVVTQLSAQEYRPHKEITVLSIKGENFRQKSMRLMTVRPFVFDSFALKDIEEYSSKRPFSDPEEELTVTEAVLHKRAEELLEKAQKEELTGHSKQPLLPLIRMKVDFSGCDENEFSERRFGYRFAHSVANPKDMVKVTRDRAKNEKLSMDSENFDEARQRNAAQLERSVEGMVKSYFSTLDDDSKQLFIITESALGRAVTEFIAKEEKNAINAAFEYQMEKARRRLKEANDPAADTEEMILNKIVQMNEYDANRKADDILKEEQQDEKEYEETKLRLSLLTAKNEPASETNGYADDAMDDTVDTSQNQSADLSVTSRGRGRGRGRGRPRGARGATTRGTRGTRSRGRGSSQSQNTSQRSNTSDFDMFD